MKILFHTHTLNFRGVTNSVVDYARYNQEILGNESAILYNPEYTLPNASNLDVVSKQPVVDYLKTKYEVLSYTNEEEMNRAAEKFDMAYSQTSGVQQSCEITSTKSVIHAVFQVNQPYGDRYAYISKWLSDTMSNGTIPYVPLIVDLPTAEKSDLRSQLGIPKDAVVIGRHGGFMTFDILWLNIAVGELLQKYSNIYFVFANTYKLINHPRAIYVNPFFGNAAKSSFINMCDAMIHGRKEGESFGLAICEGLFYNKPVFAWEEGRDKNHVEILKDTGLLYNEKNFKQKIAELPKYLGKDYKKIVEPYSAVNTMAKFKEVFID
jgi:hypothetical protein